MGAEITHYFNTDGRAVQIVSPARLRRILTSQGEDYSRPDYFSPDDQWDVEDTEAV